ncbi:type II toxin-antitoxin system RelE/ParE family toxin [Agrobacterium sp. a22-2]|uniref:type II toxin-antitoxin system RelE family toxin n=1 Tax=Agrobacterium sp. a22-2 TaxID=2283840 RepID=UPI001446FF5A|nr:type II toxin-antitoxin system RelE/ParE family toxin [Agrobacterium sp. a22-2]NKN38584.1 type II toxin-antitoxin system RelE/ParE family toxin [Agrobacterium sp. a22-2]
MAWTIDLDDKAGKQLAKVGKPTAARLIAYLEKRIAPLDDPRQQGRALQGPEFPHLWRYKVGDYRIICDIQDQKLIVLVIEIGHRSSVYR